MELDGFLKDLYEKMKEAEIQSIKEGIEVNTIFLNQNFDKTKEFYAAISQLHFADNGEIVVAKYPPLILGKKVLLADFLPDKYSFALGWTEMKSSNDRIYELEQELELISKYVKVLGVGDNQQLVFKGISSKRHKEDFEKVKEILGL